MKAAGFIFDTPWGKSLRFYDIIKEVNNSVLIFSDMASARSFNRGTTGEYCLFRLR